MDFELDQLVRRSNDRYMQFLAMLRSQLNVALRDGAHDARVRQSVLANSKGAARDFLNQEADMLGIASFAMIEEEAKKISNEIGATFHGIDLTLAQYVMEANDYLIDVLASQVQRDVATAYRNAQSLGMRTDIYIRSGDMSLHAAQNRISQEEGRRAQFTFLDRAGRQYKSTKHIRDSIRLHYITIRNETAVYTATDHGMETAFVDHPDRNYKFFGTELALHDNGNNIPLYYNVRGDIFHPGSDATLTTVRP